VKNFLIMVLMLFSLSAFSFDESGNEFEFILGPNINIKDTITAFNVTPSIGSENVKFGLNYQVGSLLGITFHGIRPTLILDYPFYFDIGDDKYFGVGPVFDVGPSFNFGGGAKQIDFLSIGMGFKARFFFNNNFGVTFTPVHFAMSFASWTSNGVGVNTGFAVSYDLFFSFIYRWE
jgi:hypothetical protein